jgi:hypothetical protein
MAKPLGIAFISDTCGIKKGPAKLPDPCSAKFGNFSGQRYLRQDYSHPALGLPGDCLSRFQVFVPMQQ